MSTEPAFATISFPIVRDERHQRAAREANAAGYAAGYATGLREAAETERAERADSRRREDEQAAALQQQTAAACAGLENAASALRSQRRETADAAASRLLEIAVDLASAIIGAAAAQGAELARAALDRALAAAEAEQPIAVRMHPDDVRLLTGATQGASLSGALPSGLPLNADLGLDRGDAIVELGDGWVDARISTALDRARRAIGERA